MTCLPNSKSKFTPSNTIYNGNSLNLQCRKVAHRLLSELKTFYSTYIAQLVKNPSAMQETLIPFLGWEDPLEKGLATHSHILGLRLWLSW